MKKYAIQNAIFRIPGELPVSPGCPIIVARSAVVAQMSVCLGKTYGTPCSLGTIDIHRPTDIAGCNLPNDGRKDDLRKAVIYIVASHLKNASIQ